MLVKTVQLDMNKFKSRNGASVSEELAYLTEAQQGISDQPFVQSEYLIDHQSIWKWV